MKTFDILDKAPAEFARYQRHIAYGLLLIVYVAASYAQPVAPQQLAYTLAAMACCPLVQNYLIKTLSRHYEVGYCHQVMLLMDALFVSYWMYALQCSVIPSLLVVIGLVYAAIWMRASWLIYFVGALIMGGSLLLFGFWQGVPIHWVDTSSAVAVLSIICFTAFISIGLAYNNHRLQWIRQQKNHAEEQVSKYLGLANKLARYAPSQIWQSIIRGEHDAQIHNKRKRLTIFFSDIQGFTELSEQMLPDDLAFILNDYFEHMSELAKRYGGTVDKFMGDAILIFFGDPHSLGAKDDANACVNMALAMLQEMKVLRNRWKNLGYQGLHIRIGINTGYCHVGNFGTSSRMSYTLVGREANLAARLQTAADVDQILVADSTFHLIKDNFCCAQKGYLHLKGLTEPVMTWQIMSRHGSNQQGLTDYIDYELDGFNLQIDLQQLKSYEGAKAIQMMEQASQRLKQEQQLIHAQRIQEGLQQADLPFNQPSSNQPSSNQPSSNQPSSHSLPGT